MEDKVMVNLPGESIQLVGPLREPCFFKSYSMAEADLFVGPLKKLATPVEDALDLPHPEDTRIHSPTVTDTTTENAFFISPPEINILSSSQPAT